MSASRVSALAKFLARSSSNFPKYQAGRDYGVYNEQFGIHGRTTVIVDREGIVRSIHSEVRDFESHPTNALDVLRSLGENPD